MGRRGLSEDTVRAVLAAPEQRFSVGSARDVLQSRVAIGPGGRVQLVRIFVDIGRPPLEVVTVYRTSRIDKYWRSED